MHDFEPATGSPAPSHGPVVRWRRAARRVVAPAIGIALVVAACALRVTAADAPPATGGREPAERRDEVARDELPRSVRIDRAGGWNAVAWASDLNTEAAQLDAAGEDPRFSVQEAGKRGVWLKTLNPPVDPTSHPVIVLKYRAQNIAPVRYAIWLEDGTGPNNGKGVWAIDCSELVADGKVHEVRRDLSKPGRPGLPTGGPFTMMAIGVSAKPGEHAWLDVVDIRFEFAGAAPAAPPPIPASAPAVVDASTQGGQAAAESARPRWEYATLTFARQTKFYVWEAGGTRVPEANYGNVDSLAALIKGLGGPIRPGPAEPSLVEALDLLGREGWEMVGVESSPEERTHTFKRRAK